MKLLLTSVFGPYGVDDDYGRKDNLMELLHNQVTREQGLFSPRMNNESYGLHLMAENVPVPALVLDFPSEGRFVREIKKGYDYVGISFIVPNFKKAKRMAELVRLHAPGSKIILGGHGTSIEGVEASIPHDHVCRGDGVAFLRGLLGADPAAPIRHPARRTSFGRHVMGIPLDSRLNTGIVLTGVGCANACRFCCTSHYFQRKYVPFLKTGREVFEVCLDLEARLKTTDFSIMDENFLKEEARARELLDLMERHGKPYTFSIFSSAETVARVGVDFLQRLGVEFLWIGVESKKEVFEKNKGADFPRLVRSLRNEGVNVLASGILFLEHHDQRTIHEDVGFMVDLNADLVQFMQLGPMPGTQLHDDYKKQGKLIEGVPREEQHGQGRIWFRHPHFTQEESHAYLLAAFRKDYEVNGPSILRMADTALQGYRATANTADPFLRLRHGTRRAQALRLHPLLGALVRFAPTTQARAHARVIRDEYGRVFGKPSLTGKFLSALAHGLMVKEMVRSRLVPDNLRQPPTRLTSYGI
ncbi:MAG: radical SAM protein [Elusimicrobia bacterium]|nr:radical SAM protein [Elusimicrobiota bacterium]